jgi:hypothetical protein
MDNLAEVLLHTRPDMQKTVDLDLGKVVISALFGRKKWFEVNSQKRISNRLPLDPADVGGRHQIGWRPEFTSCPWGDEGKGSYRTFV